jgi:hypothetical protein
LAKCKERVAIDVTYGVVFSGVGGVGMGFVTVRGGEATSTGLAGGKFKGRVSLNPATGGWHVAFNQLVPDGLTLAQGTSPQGVGISKQAEVDAPIDFGGGEPIEL